MSLTPFLKLYTRIAHEEKDMKKPHASYMRLICYLARFQALFEMRINTG